MGQNLNPTRCPTCEVTFHGDQHQCAPLVGCDNSLDIVMRENNLDAMKGLRDDAIRQAAAHAYVYARESDTGPARIKAFEAYESIQTAILACRD